MAVEYIGLVMPIVEPILKGFVSLIKKQVSYLCCYRCNVESLNDEITRLEVERETLQQAVEAAERKLEDIRPDVKDWLKRAEATKTRSDSVLSNADDVGKRCLSKWCPILHYSLSRDAKKTTYDCVELRNTTGKFDTVSNPSNPQNRQPIPLASATEIQFKSREVIEKDIMDALQDENVYLIGLCGMGGIGKTKMVKTIRSKAKMRSMFEIVVLAVVSQTPDLKDVQKQIAEGIGLPLEEHTLEIRAEKLYARLKEAQSFLIILDDVWKVIDLENLGIPSKGRGKILMTSRVRDALTLVEDAKIVTMKVLTDEEAWNLFKEKAVYLDDGHVPYETAKEVSVQCKGLPLALVAVGSALRNKREASWKDALRQLQRNLSPTNIPQVLQQIYVPLKWSYDQLQSEEARCIFLLCCLFPEDYEIPVERLIRYGWGLGFFNGIENLEEARDRVYGLVEMLKSRFLVMDTERNDDDNDGEYVKMHDVFRDMALSIATKDRFVFLVNDDRNEWPRKDSYEYYTHISVILGGNCSFPESINCPKLEFLSMNLYWGEGETPDNFFARTRGLKVLSTYMNASLTSSTCQLTNLRVLHLNFDLNELNLDGQMASLVGKLANLEIFSLEAFNMEEFPKEIGQLKSLKLLELKRCWGIAKIAPGVISGLVQLEELALYDCSFNEWETEEEQKEKRNAGLMEVASLRNLISLQIKIKNPKLLSLESPNEQKIGTFYIQIGDFHFDSDGTEKYKKVIVCECEKVTRLGSFFRSMIRNAEYLYLKGEGCVGILNELGTEGFQMVKQVHLFDCKNVEYLVQAFQMSTRDVVSFATLESLTLQNCSCLKGISCLGPRPLIRSFASLKHLMLQDLPEFKQAFPLSIVDGSSKLEDLHISNCPEMEEIFKVEEVEITANNTIKFLRLRKITLLNLPSLEAFCKGIESLEFPSLEELEISDSPKMTSFCLTKCNQSQQFLFNKEVPFTNLKTIKLSGVNGCIGIFGSGVSIDNFSGLETLEVKSCHGLRNIFSQPMFRGLTNLQRMELEDCEELRQVIAFEEGQGGQQTKIMFPQLYRLLLRQLPKIQRVCHMTHDIELSSLEYMIIEDCPMFETFSSGSDTTNFFTKQVLCTNLKRLKLYKVNGATGIFNFTIPLENFSALEILKIESCHSLRNIFSPPIFRGLQSLRMLTLNKCSELEEVIAPDEGQRAVKVTAFPKLTYLELIKLPRIRRFCHLTNDLELPSFETLIIKGCPIMETFSLGYVHLPSLKVVSGIEDQILAAKFFTVFP